MDWTGLGLGYAGPRLRQASQNELVLTRSRAASNYIPVVFRDETTGQNVYVPPPPVVQPAYVPGAPAQMVAPAAPTEPAEPMIVDFGEPEPAPSIPTWVYVAGGGGALTIFGLAALLLLRRRR